MTKARTRPGAALGALLLAGAVAGSAAGIAAAEGTGETVPGGGAQAGPATGASATPSRPAETITLHAPDGGVAVEGRLAGFDGTLYRLETPFGPIEVEAAGVTCTGAACPDPDEIRPLVRLVGAPELAGPLLGPLVEAHARAANLVATRIDEPGGTRLYLDAPDGGPTRLELQVSGPGGRQGLEAYLDRSAGLALLGRPLAAREVSALDRAGLLPAPPLPVALEPLLPAVAPGNALAEIDWDTLLGVVSGRITSWADLGGADRPIRLYLPAPGSAARRVLETRLTAPAGLSLAAGEASEDPAAALAADPDGIGVLPGHALGPARALGLRDACGARLPADAFAVKAGEYPLVREVYLLGGGTGGPQVAAFLDFLSGPEAAAAVEAAGFVSLAPVGTRLEDQGRRLADMLLAGPDVGSREELRGFVNILRSAERLSMTLRSDPATGAPDARAEADLDRLAAEIRDGRHDGRQVMLIGFTDSLGPAELNRGRSARAAAAMRSALLARLPEGHDGVRVLIGGQGELAPVACNADFLGRAANDRVEVWLRTPPPGEADTP